MCVFEFGFCSILLKFSHHLSKIKEAHHRVLSSFLYASSALVTKASQSSSKAPVSVSPHSPRPTLRNREGMNLKPRAFYLYYFLSPLHRSSCFEVDPLFAFAALALEPKAGRKYGLFRAVFRGAEMLQSLPGHKTRKVCLQFARRFISNPFKSTMYAL